MAKDRKRNVLRLFFSWVLGSKAVNPVERAHVIKGEVAALLAPVSRRAE
ncbi:hypothetical protein [Marmoricola sp. RAF53]